MTYGPSPAEPLEAQSKKSKQVLNMVCINIVNYDPKLFSTVNLSTCREVKGRD